MVARIWFSSRDTTPDGTSFLGIGDTVYTYLSGGLRTYFWRCDPPPKGLGLPSDFGPVWTPELWSRVRARFWALEGYAKHKHPKFAAALARCRSGLKEKR